MTEDYKKLKTRVDTMEEAVQILKKLALRADERMDNFDNALNNLTVKIEALTDAQIRNEEKSAAGMEALRAAQESLAAKVEALADAQIRSEERLTQKFETLADSQAQTDRRLDALIDIVREGRGGGAA